MDLAKMIPGRGKIGGRRSWPLPRAAVPIWRQARAQSHYEVIIAGDCLHGLMTAVSLAQDFGVGRVAFVHAGTLLERPLSSGVMMARRDDEAHVSVHQLAQIFDQARTAWAEQQVMPLSWRGALSLAHGQQDEAPRRQELYAALRFGVESQWLTPSAVAQRWAALQVQHPRWPVSAGVFHPDSAVICTETVLAAYGALAASLGVDLVENCAINDITQDAGHCTGVRTTQGLLRAERVLLCGADICAAVLPKLGIQEGGALAPISQLFRRYQRHVWLSEPYEATELPIIQSVGLGLRISQSQRGAFMFEALPPTPGVTEAACGGGFGRAESPLERGEAIWSQAEDVMAAALAMLPLCSRMRLREQWTLSEDLALDGLPVMGETPLDGLMISGGWGDSALTAAPVVGGMMAHHLATGNPHPLAKPFGLERFDDPADGAQGRAPAEGPPENKLDAPMADHPTQEQAHG